MFLRILSNTYYGEKTERNRQKNSIEFRLCVHNLPLIQNNELAKQKCLTTVNKKDLY